MNRWLGAFVLLLGTATLVRAQPYPEGWTRVRTRPAPPPREVLDRLNLDQAWRTYVPIDGRRDGFVFIQFIGRDMFVQTRSGLVALIDPETGVTRWRARVGKAYEPILPLTANSRSVYVVSGTFLYALDRNTGATQWRFSAPAGVSAPPSADEEQIYLPTASGRFYAFYLPRPGASAPAAPAGPQLPPETTLPSVGPLTSLRSLEAPTPIGAQPQLSWDIFPNLRLEMKPLLTNELVLVPGPSGTAVAYTRAARGNFGASEVYRFQADGRFNHPPGQLGDTAYFGSDDGNLYALDMATGHIVWRYTAGTPITRHPAATDQDVYLTSQQNGMARINRATGDAVWRVPRGREILSGNPDADRFLAANPKFVYAMDRSGRLLILDRKRGIRLSMYDVREFPLPVTNEMTDRLYLAAHDGLLVCLHDRAYPTPFRQRRTEEAVSEPIRQKLAQAISDGGGRTMSVRDLLDDFTKRYNLTFKVAEQAFAQAGGEPLGTRQVTFPRVDNRPLGEVLQQLLAQANCAYQIVGNTILIVPARR